MARQLKFYEAIREAIDISMSGDPSVYIVGLGVPDPKGTFGSTAGLQQKFGADRVMDMPCSENGMTGIAIGTALTGMRPIMVHQRIDFATLAMEQIVNQAAKWHYMFGGQNSVPLVIRLIIGRGWGQGPQHSQSLQSWFAHIPGLKVVMPATPHDAKGLLLASIRDNNPVVFLEHRWLYNISGEVPEGDYTVELGVPKVLREGSDVTIAATSYMTLEAVRCAEWLAADRINAEVIDIHTLNPLDDTPIIESVKKTGHLVVADTGWQNYGISAEIIARVNEKAFGALKSAPKRIALPECPTPTSHKLAEGYYPRAIHIAEAVRSVLGMSANGYGIHEDRHALLDIPDPAFTGPF